jgi:hypothetical protein
LTPNISRWLTVAVACFRESLEGDKRSALEAAAREAATEREAALAALRQELSARSVTVTISAATRVSLMIISGIISEHRYHPGSDRSGPYQALLCAGPAAPRVSPHVPLPPPGSVSAAESARDEAKAALGKVEAVWRAKQDAALEQQARDLEAAKVGGASMGVFAICHRGIGCAELSAICTAKAAPWREHHQQLLVCRTKSYARVFTLVVLVVPRGCGQVRAVEEMRVSLVARVDEALRDKAEALELYSQENRKRKLIHNKLLELQVHTGETLVHDTHRSSLVQTIA